MKTRMWLQAQEKDHNNMSIFDRGKKSNDGNRGRNSGYCCRVKVKSLTAKYHCNQWTACSWRLVRLSSQAQNNWYLNGSQQDPWRTNKVQLVGLVHCTPEAPRFKLEAHTCGGYLGSEGEIRSLRTNEHLDSRYKVHTCVCVCDSCKQGCVASKVHLNTYLTFLPFNDSLTHIQSIALNQWQ